jgi:hypothetical protein
MSFYLGVWNSPTAISDKEAAARYRELSDEKSAEPQFDDQVYAFYSCLTRHYPEVEMVPEDQFDACPWACGIDLIDDHMIMAIQPEWTEKVVPFVRALAAEYELVCFDPQAGKVYLPPRLEALQDTAASDPACASGSQPSGIQLNGEPELGGREDLQPNLRSGILPKE